MFTSVVLCKRLCLIWALLRCYTLHTSDTHPQGAAAHAVEGVQGVQAFKYFLALL